MDGGLVNTVLGTFKCSKKLNKNKVTIVIRNEAIKLYAVNKAMSEIVNENGFIVNLKVISPLRLNCRKFLLILSLDNKQSCYLK